MSDQTSGTDQTTGAPPPDPSNPDVGGGTAVPAPEAPEGQQPKSPDEEGGSDEAREGGTPTHSKDAQQGGDEDDDDEQN